MWNFVRKNGFEEFQRVWIVRAHNKEIMEYSLGNREQRWALFRGLRAQQRNLQIKGKRWALLQEMVLCRNRGNIKNLCVLSWQYISFLFCKTVQHRINKRSRERFFAIISKIENLSVLVKRRKWWSIRHQSPTNKQPHTLSRMANQMAWSPKQPLLETLLRKTLEMTKEWKSLPLEDE